MIIIGILILIVVALIAWGVNYATEQLALIMRGLGTLSQQLAETNDLLRQVANNTDAPKLAKKDFLDEGRS